MRIGRNDLSFIDGEAWNDIYSSSAGFERDPRWTSAGKGAKKSLISSPKADHDRYRRLLNAAFSPKALKSQEEMIQGYIGYFLDLLVKETAKASKLNLKPWFEWLFFDIDGNLSFGESFHAMSQPENRPFVAAMVEKFKAVMYLIGSAYVPWLRLPILSLVPKKQWVAHVQHRAYAREKVMKRLAEGDNPQKPDFITYLSRNNVEGKNHVTEEELVGNMDIVLIAGSETTATSSLAAMHELLQTRNRYALAKLQREIRAAFRTEAEITPEATLKLPYLSAVIEESK